VKIDRNMLLSLTMALWAAVPVQSSAAVGPEYFDGKTISFIIGTEPGGGYDIYGRLVAEYMQRHLPGSTIVPRNMPGAGHIIGTNFIYASKPDGLTIGTFNTGLIYTQLAEEDSAKFDLGNMSWIGKVASDPRVLMVTKESGIETLDQLMALETPIRFAGAGVGSGSVAETRLLIEALDLPVDLITGYNGGDDQLAMRRGEVQGLLASRSSVEDFARDTGAIFVAQVGGDDPNVPQLGNKVNGEMAERAIALIDSQVSVVRLVAGPPDIPADILGVLQNAFEAAVTDEAFLERAETLGLPVDPLVGEDVAIAVREALDQPAEMVDLVKSVMR